MEPEGSEYLDGCVGKVVSAAIMNAPDLPSEAFDYALVAGWGEPEIAHAMFLFVAYDHYGVTFGNASGPMDVRVFVPWSAIVRIKVVGDRDLLRDLKPKGWQPPGGS